MSGAFVRDELERYPFVADFMRCGELVYLREAFNCRYTFHGDAWKATMGRPNVKKGFAAIEDLLDPRKHGKTIKPSQRDLWALRLHFLVEYLVNASE